MALTADAFPCALHFIASTYLEPTPTVGEPRERLIAVFKHLTKLCDREGGGQGDRRRIASSSGPRKRSEG
jgi:hypothetical protein